jgi:hypothetical protein
MVAGALPIESEMARPGRFVGCLFRTMLLTAILNILIG